MNTGKVLIWHFFMPCAGHGICGGKEIGFYVIMQTYMDNGTKGKVSCQKDRDLVKRNE